MEILNIGLKPSFYGTNAWSVGVGVGHHAQLKSSYFPVKSFWLELWSPPHELNFFMGGICYGEARCLMFRTQHFYGTVPLILYKTHKINR